MNANNERCLGENSYKRNSDWERKRRIVVNVEEEREQQQQQSNEIVNRIVYEWTPYPNLPIAPGLPDILQHVGAYELGGYPTRSTCEDMEDGGLTDISFDLSKCPKISEEVELELLLLDDDGLNGIESYLPDFGAFNYKAETFNENDWPEFDIIE